MDDVVRGDLPMMNVRPRRGTTTPAFSVPEPWRRIARRGEQQGRRKFDVLVCGHVVPASDTTFRRFRPCAECRVTVQRYADEQALRTHHA